MNPKELENEYKNLQSIYYDIEIHNEQDLSFFGGGSGTPCDFCRSYHKNNCLFNFKHNVTIDQILNMMSSKRQFALTINWKPDVKAKLKAIENPRFAKINLNNPGERKTNNSKDISLYDCF